MTSLSSAFAVNTYAYMQSRDAGDCIAHLAARGYRAVELMLFPGHLWPAELSPGARRDLRRAAEALGVAITTLNMPNIDINVAAAAEEMRRYSLDQLAASVELAGELGVPALLIGPGKPNPLFPLPTERMMGHFFAALDRLVPLAARHGTSIAIENLPIAFLPGADDLMDALERYGAPGIDIVYDLANAVFHREDPAWGLGRVRDRLRLIHLSDTGHEVYRHDPVGRGVVPFARIPSVLDAIGYRGPSVLEIISPTPDADIEASAAALVSLGWAPRPHGATA